MELSGGSKAPRMPRAGHSRREAVLTARSWLQPVLPVEGRHPLAAAVGSVCAKMQLFLLQTLEIEPVPELNFHGTDKYSLFQLHT